MFSVEGTLFAGFIGIRSHDCFCKCAKRMMTGASHFQNSTGMRRGKFWCRGARCPAKLVFAGEMMMEIQFSVIELSPRAVWGKLSL